MEERKWPKKAEAKKPAEAKAPPFDKRLLLALIAIVALAIVFAIIVLPKNNSSPAGASISFKAIANGETILDSTAMVAMGTNAFDAMQEIANVEFQDFGAMGVMVEAINGVKPGQNEFWGLYVNGEQSMAGISGITIEADTAIEWKIESVESYTG